MVLLVLRADGWWSFRVTGVNERLSWHVMAEMSERWN